MKLSGLRIPRPDLSWPYLLGLGALIGLPAIWATALAFTDYTGLGDVRFIGLDNFRTMLGDRYLRQSIGNTAFYVALAVPLRVGAATALALLLHGRGRWNEPARAVVYLPTIIPDIAYALLWAWILNPVYGPLASLATQTGMPSPGWLTDPWSARVAIAVMGGLQIGEGFVILLAWRRTIPPKLYEAAAVEGASPWFVVRRVTLPLMAPALVLLALRDVLLSLQLSFVPALLITDGGPRRATTYLPMFLYDHAFRYFRLGYASAVAVTMFATTGIVLALQHRLLRRWRLL